MAGGVVDDRCLRGRAVRHVSGVGEAVTQPITDPMSIAVAQEIKRHTIDDKITSATLYERLSIPDAALRVIVHALRLAGYPIASTNAGYWWAATAEEIDPTIAHLKGRAVSLYEVVRSLEKSRARLAIGKDITIGQQEELMI